HSDSRRIVFLCDGLFFGIGWDWSRVAGRKIWGAQVMAYRDKVVEHYNNPRNVGSLPKEDPNVGTGLVGAPECGDVMKLQMRINPDTNVIEEAKFKTFGCGSAIASSSLATELGA